MKNLFAIIGLLLSTSFIAYAQQIERTEEYTFLELNTRCNKAKLSLTNNAHGTAITEHYDRKTSTLTDDERLLIAMNDLNGKGYKLKSTTVVAEKCRLKRVFMFYKTREKSNLLTRTD